VWFGLSCIGRSHMVQRATESVPSSSADIQHSVFASVDSVAAFSATAAREQEQSERQIPHLAELQVPSPSPGKTSAASKKKLMSMAFQAQKQRHEAAASAAAAAAAAAAATETSSNAGTVSSSDTDTSPARGHDHNDCSFTRITNVQSLHDGKKPAGDDSCISEQCDTAEQRDAASLQPASEAGSQLHDTLVDGALAADDTDAVLVVRATGAVAAPPKTLTPAKTLPLSLVTAVADPDDRRHSIDVLSSPVKLVPPADPQHIHAIVVADVPSMPSDSETTHPDSAATEEQ